jgi:hypothetical protein
MALQVRVRVAEIRQPGSGRCRLAHYVNTSVGMVRRTGDAMCLSVGLARDLSCVTGVSALACRTDDLAPRGLVLRRPSVSQPVLDYFRLK